MDRFAVWVFGGGTGIRLKNLEFGPGRGLPWREPVAPVSPPGDIYLDENPTLWASYREPC